MENNNLSRRLGLIDSTSIVVGTIIGTGVFLKAAIMTSYLGSGTWVLLAWVLGGLLSLTGALAYAELGILFPKAGGEYVYLKEAYGDLVAFLYGWMRFWIGGPGSIAAYSVGSATFASKVFDISQLGGKSGLALIFIAGFTGLNCLAVSIGGRIQSIMTAVKVFMILFLIGGLFISPTSSMDNFSSTTTAFMGWSAFGSALLASLWAYDGWNNLPMVAGEIKNPSRNIPLALIAGMIIILAIYGSINFSYFYALPTAEVLSANSKLNPDALPVATKAATTFLGDSGIWFLSIAMLLSALGAMNGSMLTAARVPFALAKDGLFFKALAMVNPKNHVPVVSVLVQGLIAATLAMSGTFDQLTDYVVFSSWIFYALTIGALYIFRRKLPHAERSYKAWGYPFLPLFFMISSVLILLNTIITSPADTLKGLMIIGAGVPAFFILKKMKK